MYSVFYFAKAGTLVAGAMLCPLLLRRFGKRNLSLASATCPWQARLWRWLLTRR